MHLHTFVSALALTTLGSTAPTPPSYESKVLLPRQSPNCSAIHEFYIQSKGGQMDGFYGSVDPEEQYIFYDQRTTRNATKWTTNARNWLVIAESSPGVTKGNIATMFKRSYGDFFISVGPPSSLKNEPPYNRVVAVRCYIGAEANGTCPLQCSAQVHDQLLNFEYSWRGGKGHPAFADLGVENPGDPFLERIQMVAVPPRH